MNLPPPESHLAVRSRTRLADGSYKVVGVYKEEAGRKCILCREETHDFQGRMNQEGTWLSRYSLHRNHGQCLKIRERKLEAKRGGKKPRPLRSKEEAAPPLATNKKPKPKEIAEEKPPQKTPGRKPQAEKPQAASSKKEPTGKPGSQKASPKAKPAGRKPAGRKPPAVKTTAAKSAAGQPKKPGGQKTRKRGSQRTTGTARRSGKQ